MKVLALLVLLVATPASGSAQSLQVGGLEVRIGETFERALARLSPVYEMQHLETGSSVEELWWVRRRSPARDVIGLIRERNGMVSGITRDWSGDAYSLAHDFVRLLEEARRLGGETECRTVPDYVQPASGKLVLTGYTTTCGRYTVEHNIAWRIGDAPLSRETLAISVR